MILQSFLNKCSQLYCLTFHITQHPLMCTRIELQYKVCRLGKSPHISDMQSVEREREALASHMVTLTHSQNAANIVDRDCIAPSRITHDNEAEFDNSDDHLDNEDTPVALGPSHLLANTHAIPVEEQQVYLPCNGELAEVEINLCKIQAS